MTQTARRQCLPCTACCDGWLGANIRGHKVTAGKPCPYSTPCGCAIYADRPEQPCRVFTCSWVVDNSPLPDWMRPNISGAIVLLNMPWQKERVIWATPVGESIPEATLNWLKDYARKYKRPLIFHERIVTEGVFSGLKRFGFGGPEFRSRVASMTAEELDAALAMGSS